MVQALSISMHIITSHKEQNRINQTFISFTITVSLNDFTEFDHFIHIILR